MAEILDMAFEIGHFGNYFYVNWLMDAPLVFQSRVQQGYLNRLVSWSLKR